jgi:serine/threonine protein kinase
VPPDTDPRIGTVLQGRYRIDQRIGAGGMGVVYKAERVGLGRRVAIKFLHADLAADPALRTRFEREAKAMSQLHHPHCVPVIDFGVADAPYLVLEYVPGESLTQLINRGPLPVKRAVNIMRQILAGLEHAHGLGIIHRDIKPDNVILAEVTGTGDQARLFDFGLAKIVSDAQQSVARAPSAMAIGTPSYMSPEQAVGDSVDARSDVYGCGIVLFQMLTGKKPFSAKEPMDVLRMHVEKRPPTLAEGAGDRQFPAPLEAIVSRALSKRPEQRFPTALDFAEALENLELSPPPVVEKDAPVLPPRPAEPAPLIKPEQKSRKWAVISWLILLLLATAVGVVVYKLYGEVR